VDGFLEAMWEGIKEISKELAVYALIGYLNGLP
jgi:hypothetical protein